MASTAAAPRRRARSRAPRRSRRPAGPVARRPPHPHDPLRRGPRAGGARRRGRRGRGPAARAHRPRHAGGLPRRPGRGRRARRPRADPRRRDQRRRRSDPDLWEGELHILGFGMDPDDDAFEAALAAPASATPGPVRADGRPSARARAADRRRRSPTLDLRDDDALGRPTIARALIAARVTRRASRTPSSGSSGAAARRTCRAPGLGPVEAIEAIRAAGGLAALAHFREAPVASRPAPRADRCGPRRARGLLPLVRPADDRGDGARSRRRTASSRPVAPTTTATGDLRRVARQAVGPAGGRRWAHQCARIRKSS